MLHYTHKLKWIKYLNIRPQTINLLNNNKKKPSGEKFYDMELNKNFLDVISKAQATK